MGRRTGNSARPISPGDSSGHQSRRVQTVVAESTDGAPGRADETRRLTGAEAIVAALGPPLPTGRGGGAAPAPALSLPSEPAVGVTTTSGRWLLLLAGGSASRRLKWHRHARELRGAGLVPRQMPGPWPCNRRHRRRTAPRCGPAGAQDAATQEPAISHSGSTSQPLVSAARARPLFAQGSQCAGGHAGTRRPRARVR